MGSVSVYSTRRMSQLCYVGKLFQIDVNCSSLAIFNNNFELRLRR